MGDLSWRLAEAGSGKFLFPQVIADDEPFQGAPDYGAAPLARERQLRVERHRGAVVQPLERLAGEEVQLGGRNVEKVSFQVRVQGFGTLRPPPWQAETRRQEPPACNQKFVPTMNIGSMLPERTGNARVRKKRSIRTPPPTACRATARSPWFQTAPTS